MKTLLELNKIIRNYIAKKVAGRSDDGIMITLQDPQKVDFQTAMMQNLFISRGIDPNSITSEKQLMSIINQVKAIEKAENTAQSGIKNTESAKVFNRAGEELDPNKPIIGGTQEGKKIDQDTFIRLAETNTQRMKQKIADKKIDDDLPPPGSRGGPDDIAAPVQSAEESLKDMIMAENKKNIAAMKKRKMLDDAIEDASPGFADDIKYDSEIVAENLAERMGLVYDDLPTKQRLDLYDQAYTGLSKQRFKNKPRPDDDPEDFAKGGIARIGLKEGTGMTRRTFMKIFSGLVALPIIGKVLKPLKVGKTVTKVPIIKTDNVPGKPEWFDQLVNKVILEGEDMTKQFATKEREIVHATKIGKDDYIRVTQDLDEGAVRVEYESPENMYGDSVSMKYKKPLPDEDMPRGGAAEFNTAESGPVGRADGPDDYSIEIDELGGTSISDLTSDVSKLKQYATGKKPTLKEIVQIKKRKDRAASISEGGANEMDEVVRRQGDYVDYDDYASGGIAGMLGE